MKVKFLKEHILNGNCYPCKEGQMTRLKENLAKKLWLKDIVEILGPHDFVKPLKKDNKKEIN